MLCRHSLASLRDAVKTIFGEPTETSTKPLIGNVLGTYQSVPVTLIRALPKLMAADSSICYASCQA